MATELEEMEYGEDSYTIPSWDGEEEFHVSNIVGNGGGIRTRMFNPEQKGLHSFNRKINKTQKKNIDVFETPDIPNAKIRNAVTGIHYTKESDDGLRLNYYYVGSREQDYFFKVKMMNGDTKSALVLFYDSPEDYEKHQLVILSDAVKKQWRDKYNSCREYFS